MTPPDYGQMMLAAANGDTALASWMGNTMLIENPNFNPGAVSWTGVQGMAQITQATWATVNPGVPYSTDPQAQLNTMAKLLAQYANDYNGDYTLAYTAYNAGPAVANMAQSLIQEGASRSDALSQALGQYYSGVQLSQKTAAIQKASTLDASNPVALAVNAASQATPYLTDDSDPAVAVPVAGMRIPASQLVATQTAIDPPLIIDAGLDEQAWFANKNMVRANRPTSDIPDPVTFQIYFDVAGNPLPVIISMVASVRTSQRGLRHVPTRQRTMTGLLLNIWGMAPDQISGQASTGLMANALGVTDFLSLSTVPSGVQKQIRQALTGLNPSEGLVDDPDFDAVMQPDAMRIAAKDAFVEFLMMFKNNGTVWFRTQNYSGSTTGMSQQGVDVWSPATGSTIFQNAARRNDVMTRGQVVMYFRNTAYYGYFKTLGLMMDAKNPFRWNFNFVFQVESTMMNVQVPLS